MFTPYEDRREEIPFASAEYISFASRKSFLGVPAVTPGDLGEGDVVIVGAPFDWGTSHRPGARFGPSAIRNADYGAMDGYRPHLPTGIDAFETLGVVDVGDVYVRPGELEASIDRIADAVEGIANAGKVPIVLGGDHTITWPDALGVARAHGFGEVALIHFDAHADTGFIQNGSLFGHGTPMRRLIESGAVPGHRFVQIGLRGYWPEPQVMEWQAEQRMRSYRHGPDRRTRSRPCRRRGGELLTRRRSEGCVLVHRHRRRRPWIGAGDRDSRARWPELQRNCSTRCVGWPGI